MAALIEVPAERVPRLKQCIADAVYQFVRTRLNTTLPTRVWDIGPVSIRWFRADRTAQPHRYSYARDHRKANHRALADLSSRPYHYRQGGLLTYLPIAADPDPVMWLRVTMRPDRLAELVAHEARHLWQYYKYGDERMDEWRERDAYRFAETMHRRCCEIAYNIVEKGS